VDDFVQNFNDYRATTFPTLKEFVLTSLSPRGMVKVAIVSTMVSHNTLRLTLMMNRFKVAGQPVDVLPVVLLYSVWVLRLGLDLVPPHPY
jgi:hypothetical protein